MSTCHLTRLRPTPPPHQNIVLAVTFGLGSNLPSDDQVDPAKQSAPFLRASELSSTIGEYLEKIVGACRARVSKGRMRR